MSELEKTVMLADPHQALEAYLEGLLTGEPAPDDQASPSLEIRSEPAPIGSPPRAEAPVRPVEAKQIAVPLAERILRLPSPQPIEEPSLRGRELVPVEPAPVRSGRPEWADEPFPCLLFRVCGLSLAVPLVHLNGVLPWSDDITPMPGHQAWFLGLMRHQEQGVKVVDTATLVVPPDRLEAALADGERSLGNIVLIDEGRWGLACEAVDEMISLDPDGVRWRTNPGTRPWLAGTVIEHMCALIDASAFAEMLATGHR